jgi:hypothetical protein
VNKAVDNYVYHNQKPSIFDDFDLFAQILGRKIDQLFQ